MELRKADELGTAQKDMGNTEVRKRKFQNSQYESLRQVDN
jgi:hypothetical protein